MDRGRVEPGDPIGQHDVTRAALLGELHQADDLGQERILAGGTDRERERRAAVERPGEHPLARPRRGAAGSRR